MKNFKNKLLMLMVLSTVTTSILPLTFFDDGSIVHRGGPGEGREHFWNRGSHDSANDRNSRRDDRDYRDDNRRRNNSRRNNSNTSRNSTKNETNRSNSHRRNSRQFND